MDEPKPKTNTWGAKAILKRGLAGAVTELVSQLSGGGTMATGFRPPQLPNINDAAGSGEDASRAPSLDPDKGEEPSAPHLAKETAPAIKIEPDRLVESLTKIHEHIISYLDTIDHNNTAESDYLGRKIKNVATNVAALTQKTATLERTQKSSFERIDRSIRDIRNRLDLKKSPWLAGDADNKPQSQATATQVRPSSNIAGDIEKYLTGAGLLKLGTALLGSAPFIAGVGSIAIVEVGNWLERMGYLSKFRAGRAVGPYDTREEQRDAARKASPGIYDDTPARRQQLRDIENYQRKSQGLPPLGPNERPKSWDDLDFNPLAHPGMRIMHPRRDNQSNAPASGGKPLGSGLHPNAMRMMHGGGGGSFDDRFGNWSKPMSGSGGGRGPAMIGPVGLGAIKKLVNYVAPDDSIRPVGTDAQWLGLISGLNNILGSVFSKVSGMAGYRLPERLVPMGGPLSTMDAISMLMGGQRYNRPGGPSGTKGPLDFEPTFAKQPVPSAMQRWLAESQVQLMGGNQRRPVGGGMNLSTNEAGGIAGDYYGPSGDMSYSGHDLLAAMRAITSNMGHGGFGGGGGGVAGGIGSILGGLGSGANPLGALLKMFGGGKGVLGGAIKALGSLPQGSRTTTTTGTSTSLSSTSTGSAAGNAFAARQAAEKQLIAEGVPPENAKYAAAALIGQALAESNLKSQFHDQGQRVGAAGGYVKSIYGADLSRGKGMVSWIQSQGGDPADVNWQAKYMAHEVMNRSAAEKQAIMTASSRNIRCNIRCSYTPI